jgi:hypothetical protein
VNRCAEGEEGRQEGGEEEGEEKVVEVRAVSVVFAA